MISPAANLFSHSFLETALNVAFKKSIAVHEVLAGMPTMLGPTPWMTGGLYAFEDDIPHTMPQLQAAIFKLGKRAIAWFDGIPALILRGCVF
jgi:hypothetical protein